MCEAECFRAMSSSSASWMRGRAAAAPAWPRRPRWRASGQFAVQAPVVVARPLSRSALSSASNLPSRAASSSAISRRDRLGSAAAVEELGERGARAAARSVPKSGLRTRRYCSGRRSRQAARRGRRRPQRPLGARRRLEPGRKSSISWRPLRSSTYTLSRVKNGSRRLRTAAHRVERLGRIAAKLLNRMLSCSAGAWARSSRSAVSRAALCARRAMRRVRGARPRS